MEVIGMSMGIFGTIFVTTGDQILKLCTMCWKRNKTAEDERLL
jgi:hypothetical protein